MDTAEVYSYLRYLPVNSFGVYASDCLPLKITPSSAFVVNTDPHTSAGTHWVAFFLDLHGNLEYFDSYGRPPTVPDHIQFIRRNSCCYRYNTMPLQSEYSLVCGHYCLTFLYLRSLGFQMKDFTSIFSENVNKNDALVYKVFNYMFIL